MNARRRTFRALLLVQVALLVGMGIAVRGTAGLDHAFTRELWLIRFSGYTALGFLFASLSITPLRRLVAAVGRRGPSNAAWMAWRRGLGMTAAWWALGHGGSTFATYLADARTSVLHEPYLRAGLVAVVLLALLLATSFPRLVKGLRIRLWKPLHVLAYAAAFLVFQHLMLSPFAPRGRTLWLFAAFAAVGALRALPRMTGPKRAGTLASRPQPESPAP